MKKVAIICIVLLVSITIIEQKRSFFRASNGEYITMWKRSDNICYLIPGKYYGFFKPKDGYIETTNNASAGFIWNSNNRIIYSGKENSKIVNTDTSKIKIINYMKDKKKNDSLYIEKQGKYDVYKKGVIHLGIDILEGY